MSEKTRVSTSFKIAALVLLTAALIVCGIGLYKAYFPESASYTLDATTERVTLVTHKGGPKFAWSDLVLKKADDQSISCAIRPLAFGDHGLQVELTKRSKRNLSEATAKLARMQATEIHVSRIDPGTDGSTLKLECVDGRSFNVSKSADMEFAYSELLSGGTLSFFSNVSAGGLPDIFSSRSLILLSGTVRAAAKLVGSTRPGTSNAYDLHPGDEVSIGPKEAQGSTVATGLIWPTEDGLRVVAHANSALVSVKRLGLGAGEQLNLTPTPLAILQANPLWGLVTVLCTALAGIASLISGLVRSKE